MHVSMLTCLNSAISMHFCLLTLCVYQHTFILLHSNVYVCAFRLTWLNADLHACMFTKLHIRWRISILTLLYPYISLHMYKTRILHIYIYTYYIYIHIIYIYILYIYTLYIYTYVYIILYVCTYAANMCASTYSTHIRQTSSEYFFLRDLRTGMIIRLAKISGWRQCFPSWKISAGLWFDDIWICSKMAHEYGVYIPIHAGYFSPSMVWWYMNNHGEK